MSTPATASYASYYCPKEGCPPREDPAWVHIFMLSCFLFFMIILNLTICWMACIRRRQPEEDVEQGPREQRAPPDEQESNGNNGDSKVAAADVVDFVRWKAAGLGFRDEVFRGKEGEECVICLGEFEDGVERSVVTSCGHCFHRVCLESWLVKADRKINPTCPLCRASIGPPYDRVKT